ncbi:hypothetical protein B0H14DRAFT_2572399 [Mycena olivaceomarginata]|nr:hypothetical protein B0H14DRAFT_2572399 [Mycena olivaceomarginata]
MSGHQRVSGVSAWGPVRRLGLVTGVVVDEGGVFEIEDARRDRGGRGVNLLHAWMSSLDFGSSRKDSLTLSLRLFLYSPLEFLSYTVSTWFIVQASSFAKLSTVKVHVPHAKVTCKLDQTISTVYTSHDPLRTVPFHFRNLPQSCTLSGAAFLSTFDLNSLYPQQFPTAILFKYLSALIRQVWIPLKCMFASPQGGINVGSSAPTESLKIWISMGLMDVSFVLDYPPNFRNVTMCTACCKTGNQSGSASLVRSDSND